MIPFNLWKRIFSLWPCRYQTFDSFTKIVRAHSTPTRDRDTTLQRAPWFILIGYQWCNWCNHILQPLIVIGYHWCNHILQPVVWLIVIGYYWSNRYNRYSNASYGWLWLVTILVTPCSWRLRVTLTSSFWPGRQSTNQNSTRWFWPTVIAAECFEWSIAICFFWGYLFYDVICGGSLLWLIFGFDDFACGHYKLQLHGITTIVSTQHHSCTIYPCRWKARSSNFLSSSLVRNKPTLFTPTRWATVSPATKWWVGHMGGWEGCFWSQPIRRL